MAGLLGTHYVKTQTSVLAADTVGNTTTATAFGTSHSVQAESMSAVGRRMNVEAWGPYSTDAVLGHALTMDLLYGSTVICTTGSKSLTLGGASANEWYAKFAMVCGTTGLSGVVEAHGLVDYETSGLTPDAAFARGTTTAVNWTATQSLGLRVTWGTASASNTITQRILLVDQGGAL